MARAGWINGETGSAISKLVMYISLPCYMIWNITDTFDRDKFLTLVGGILIPVLSMSMAYLISIAVGKAIKVPKGHIGIFRSVFFCSNTIFIGLPVNLALFGEKSVQYVLLYYIVNTTFFWTIGAFEISRDGKGAASLFSKATLKRITSPALLGFITAIILVLLRIKLPQFAMTSMKYLGNLTTPLALIFIGLVLSSVKLSQFKFNREILLILIGRFVVSPLLVILLLRLIHVPDLMGDVFIIQSAMPAMTNTSIVAKEYSADYEFASVVTVITTIVSITVIPFLRIFM